MNNRRKTGSITRRRGSAATIGQPTLDRWLSAERISQNQNNNTIGNSARLETGDVSVQASDDTTNVRWNAVIGYADAYKSSVDSNVDAGAAPGANVAAASATKIAGTADPLVSRESQFAAKMCESLDQKYSATSRSASAAGINGLTRLLPRVQHADALQISIQQPWRPEAFAGRPVDTISKSNDTTKMASSCTSSRKVDERDNGEVEQIPGFAMKLTGVNYVDLCDDSDSDKTNTLLSPSTRCISAGNVLDTSDESEVEVVHPSVAVKANDNTDISDSDEIEIIASPLSVPLPDNSRKSARDEEGTVHESRRGTPRQRTMTEWSIQPKTTKTCKRKAIGTASLFHEEEESGDDDEIVHVTYRQSLSYNLPPKSLLNCLGCRKDSSPLQVGYINDSSDLKRDTNTTSDSVATSPTPATYTLETFKRMWEAAEINAGMTTEELEDSKGIRAANSKVAAKDSCGQEKAQYGRIMPDASQMILDKFLQVDASRGDVVVDIGCGIGNFVLQSAFVSGCEARGIEVDEHRYVVATQMFQQDLCEQQHLKLNLYRDNMAYVMGKTEIRNGRLEDENQRDFLTVPSTAGGTIRAFCNNYNNVFGHRSSKQKQMYHLDDYIAGLLALLSPGSVMVTLHPLPLICKRSQIAASRKKRRLPCSNPLFASFYEKDECILGEARDVVSWGGGKHDIVVYRYTRLRQGTPREQAVFLCCNPKCERAILGEPIPATKEVVNAHGTKSHVMNWCDCKQDERPSRSRPRMNYGETG